jgi:hypothetical protein
VPTTSRALPPRPALVNFRLPSTARAMRTDAIAERCYARQTLTCVGGDTCDASSVPTTPATPKPSVGGLQQCSSDADCAALSGGTFECYVGACVKAASPGGTCAPGAIGCVCRANDADQCDKGLQCVGAACVTVLLTTPPQAPGNNNNNGTVDLYNDDGTPIYADIGCVRGDAGCLCTEFMRQCRASYLRCSDHGFCVEAVRYVYHPQVYCFRNVLTNNNQIKSIVHVPVIGRAIVCAVNASARH